MATHPLKLTAPEPSERDIHAACARALGMLVMPPAVWFTYPAGAAQLSPQQMAAYSRVGLRRGFPDIMLIHDARIFGVELKTRHGALSKTKVVRTPSGAPRILIGQVERFAELEAAGMRIAICRSVDEVLAQITRWGIPVRGRVALEQPYRESP
jgi:hypothetical protein